MIAYINSRLVLWAEWELKKADTGLGFPRECPYTRLMARSGGSGYQPDIDGDALEIAGILARLKKDQEKLYRATHLFYGVEFKNGKAISVNLTKEQIAKDLGCHRDTFYAWLDKAHLMILDALHEHDVISHLR